MPEQTDNICKRCGKTYEECKYPVSHAHPTIDNITVDDSYMSFLSACPSMHRKENY